MIVEVQNIYSLSDSKWKLDLQKIMHAILVTEMSLMLCENILI